MAEIEIKPETTIFHSPFRRKDILKKFPDTVQGRIFHYIRQRGL